LRPLLFLVIPIGLFLGGRVVRTRFGLEFSAASVLAWLETLGWHGPLIFIGLVGFRTFVFLPSAVVLSAGGLLFGALGGTALGSIGVILSGLVLFGMTRVLGDDWLPARVRVAAEGFERRTRRAGPLALGAITAHPLGPMAAVHAAAGLSAMTLGSFLVPVILGAPIRAFGYSLFGMSLADVGSGQFYIATGVLLGLIVVPLAHPDLRRRVLGNGER
jgi:uncharacterized membrane protein YdjX (TVP38/TMEM64 family)